MGERRHPASPRRLAAARRRGHVPSSAALTRAAALLGLAALLYSDGATVGGALQAYLTRALAAPLGTGSPPLASLRDGLGIAAPVLGALLVGPALLAWGVGWLQTRGTLSARPIVPTWARLDPRGGLGRVVRAPVAAELLWRASRAAVLVVVTILGVGAIAPAVQHVSRETPAAPLRAFAGLLVLLAVAQVVWGLFDLWRHRRAHALALRMSSDELRREAREEHAAQAVRGRADGAPRGERGV